MAKKYDNRKPSRREPSKKRAMSAIEAEGKVTQTLGYENFKVMLDNGIEILANVSGKIRQHHIKVVTGDRVKVEMSPYDLTRGRIVIRYKVNM